METAGKSQAETTVTIQNNRADTPLKCVAAWVRGVEKRTLSIGLQFASLPLKFKDFPKLRRAVWAPANKGLPAPYLCQWSFEIRCYSGKSSGKVQALPLLGGICLKYIPTVFHLAREGKKPNMSQARPAVVLWESWEKAVVAPTLWCQGTSLPSHQHTKPVVALQCREAAWEGRAGSSSPER